MIKLYLDEIWLCPPCKQIDWKGSHYERMEGLIERISTWQNE